MPHGQIFLSLLIYLCFIENFTGQGQNLTEMYNSDSGNVNKKKEKRSNLAAMKQLEDDRR